MKPAELQAIYQTMGKYEIKLLTQSMIDLEQAQNIRFTSVQAYIDHLAIAVREKQCQGEFVPRNQEEAQAGCYLKQ